jgi:hypothetical protein
MTWPPLRPKATAAGFFLCFTMSKAYYERSQLVKGISLAGELRGDTQSSHPQEILALREFPQRQVTQSANFGVLPLIQARISLKLHGSLFGGFGNQSDTY